MTAAGDNQVRVFDATLALAVKDGLETEFSARELSGRVIRCHTQRVKKLVTEDSPDVFLSLSEVRLVTHEESSQVLMMSLPLLALSPPSRTVPSGNTISG